MVAIERDNPTLKGVLPKDYARPGARQAAARRADRPRSATSGWATRRAARKDILGRVYEYFLVAVRQRRGQEGRRVLHAALRRPGAGRDARAVQGPRLRPLLRLGGMFVQSEKFVERTPRQRNGGKRIGDISIYGQESNPTTWRLAQDEPRHPRHRRPDLAHADTFHRDLHPDLKADYILANPPFNVSDWGGERLRDDVRWQYGVPPAGNANFAWVQHIIHHLAPSGVAGFVLANGSMSSNQSGEGEIRKSIIEADLVDCMVALPGQLFYSTQIPVCLWFLARDKQRMAAFRDRRGQMLFIDARKLGTWWTATHRELTDDDIASIAGTYHAWRGDKDAGEYADVAGFCKSATLEEIRKHGHVLTPGRYVGAEADEDDGEPFDEKMERLTAMLREQKAESAKLGSCHRSQPGGAWLWRSEATGCGMQRCARRSLSSQAATRFEA